MHTVQGTELNTRMQTKNMSQMLDAAQCFCTGIICTPFGCSVKKEIMWTISYISAGTSDQVAQLSAAGERRAKASASGFFSQPLLL